MELLSRQCHGTQVKSPVFLLYYMYMSCSSFGRPVMLSEYCSSATSVIMVFKTAGYMYIVHVFFHLCDISDNHPFWPRWWVPIRVWAIIQRNTVYCTLHFCSWYASGIFQASFVEPWFMFWHDAVKPK